MASVGVFSRVGVQVQTLRPRTRVLTASSSSACAIASSQRSAFCALSICSSSCLARFSSSPDSLAQFRAVAWPTGDAGVCSGTAEAIKSVKTLSDAAVRRGNGMPPLIQGKVEWVIITQLVQRPTSSLRVTGTVLFGSCKDRQYRKLQGQAARKRQGQAARTGSAAASLRTPRVPVQYIASASLTGRDGDF